MELPIGKTQAQEAALWMRKNFEGQINEVITGTPWKMELVIAIALQETAYKWIRWIDKYDADTILARCVFDVSGEPEFPAQSRSAFPKNRADFIAHYGQDFYKLLNDEYNLQRAMPQIGFPYGYHDLHTPYLAKGYGIFQYDLQNIVNDHLFFFTKQWYSFSECLVKLAVELNMKAQAKNTLHDIVKCYNGSGIRAENYANNVMQFAEWV